MDGKGQTLFWFQNEKVKIEVPFFQRPYVWNEDDWTELLDSIKNANYASMPFLGSLILQKLTDRFYVIDGQQRITTLFVMIKAFVNAIKLPDGIKSQLLNFVYETTYYNLDTIYTPRLIPSNVDKPDFDAVMTNKDEDIPSRTGLIAKAYSFFFDYFSRCTEDERNDIGAKLVTNNKFFIVIELDIQDDEQKIFDSVNSLGKDLTKSDIIKNYLYQKMKEAVNNDSNMVNQILLHHQKYWENTFYSDERRDFWENQKPLGRVKTNNLEAFLKDYAIIKGFYSAYYTGGLEGLAKAYKGEINKMDYGELVAFSKELSDYANCYYTYNNEYLRMDDFRISDVVNTTLLILDCLETTTFNPYILKLIKSASTDMEDKMFALQKFVFKRFIYKAKTKNYNKVCDVLLNTDDEIQYLTNYEDDSYDIREYPTGLKKISNKQATLVLFILELIRREGQENNYSDTMKYPLSLEHIMPQKWEKNWRKVPAYQFNAITNNFDIITGYEEVTTNRKKMILSIGNMTLLTANLNSKLGNASFPEKIQGNARYSGYEKYAGSLSVAKEIIDVYFAQRSWDEKDIFRRNLTIFEDLNSYYEFTDTLTDISTAAYTTTPSVMAHSLEKQNEVSSYSYVNYSLYETDRFEKHTLDEDFVHSKICAFELNGVRQQVSTWKDASVRLCKILYKDNPNLMKTFINNNEFKGSKNFYFVTKETPRKTLKIDKNVYVWTNLSANYTASLMKKVLEKYNIPMSNFVVYLRADYKDLHRNLEQNDVSIIEENHNSSRTSLVQQSETKYINRKVNHINSKFGYGTIKGESDTTITILFDNGKTSTFTKESFDRGLLIFVD